MVELDGRTVDPTPDGFEKEAGAALADERVALLVDAFERCRGLEGWLRDRFLPRLPAGVVTSSPGAAARNRPGCRTPAGPNSCA